MPDPTHAEKFANLALPSKVLVWGVCVAIAVLSAGAALAVSINLIQGAL